MRTIIPLSHQVRPFAIMIICKDIELSPTMLRKTLQRCCKENDHMTWSTGGVHKTVPENWQILTTQIQTCPQIWKYWVALTMSWHRKSNCHMMLKILGNSGGWSTPQIQACCAEDVDKALQAKCWVLTRSKHIVS